MGPIATIFFFVFLIVFFNVRNYRKNKVNRSSAEPQPLRIPKDDTSWSETFFWLFIGIVFLILVYLFFALGGPVDAGRYSA